MVVISTGILASVDPAMFLEQFAGIAGLMADAGADFAVIAPLYTTMSLGWAAGKLTAVSVPRMRPDGTLETAPTAAPAAAVAVPDKVAEELQRIEDGFADIRSKGGAGKERRAEELRAERMAEGHQVVSSEISLFKAALKTVISGAVRHEVRKSNAGAAVASVRRSMVQRPDFEHLKNSPAAAGSIEVAAAAAETPPKPENVEAQRAFFAVDPVEVQSGSDSDSGPESAAKADPDASPDA